MDQTKKTQLQKVAMMVNRQSNQDQSGHDFGHIRRVVLNAQLLLEKEKKADAFLVLLASYLHDSYDEKLVKDVDLAKSQVRKDLVEQVDLTNEQVTAVFDIIDHVSFQHSLNSEDQLPLNTQIVQDADRLDAIGSIGIARAFRYGVTHGNVDYDEQIPPRQADEITPENYHDPQPILNHFSEKLFKLENLMNTKTAKKLAKGRTKIMHDFVDEYIAEYRGER